MTAIPVPPPRDPRTTRYSTRVMARARELVDAGWTAGETRTFIAQEFGLDRPPSLTTIRAWTEPGYRELHAEWQRKCTSKKRLPGIPTRLTPALLLALRVEDNLTYGAIAAVVRRFFGEERSEDEWRHRLYELGAPKNPNKTRSRTTA